MATRPGSLTEAIGAHYGAGRQHQSEQQSHAYGDFTAMRELSARVADDPTLLDALPEWQRTSLATFRLREANLARQQEDEQE